MFTTRLTLD